MTESQYERARDEAELRSQMPPIEEPQSTGTVSQSDVERMIQQALQRQDQAHQAQMDELRGQLANARAALPAGLVPEHAGGIGVDNLAESWSQYDQELALAGNHPHQDNQSADWLAHPDDVEEKRIGPNTAIRTRKSAQRDQRD